MIDELKNMGLITPIFTIVGVLIGTLLTFVTSWVLKSRETRLKISGQLIEKRIEAHELILGLAKSMRATISTDKLNSEREYITYPIIFSTEEDYLKWRTDFLLISNQYSHWLGSEVTKELYFIQDYVGNLDKRLNKAPKENYIAIGIILKNDFVEMAANIEKSVIRFLGKGWRNLKIKELKGNHKYPKKLTLKRLNDLNLYKRHLEIHKYLEKEIVTIPHNGVKKITELYDIAPNDSKTNIITLREVPNIDNSGVNYEISYKDNEDYGKVIKFGHCDLILGNIMFDKIDNEAKTLGVNYRAVKLLTDWINENLEESIYDDRIIEYEE